MVRRTIACSLLLVVAPLAGCDRETAVPAAVETPPETVTAGPRSSVADNPGGWPPVEFEPAVMDFGILPPGETAQGRARIWNVGDRALHVKSSRTSCGCTEADRLDGRVIPAGNFLEFATSMEPKSGLGEKKEKVGIVFAGYDVEVEYFLEAEVSFPVRVSPPHITAVGTLQGVMTVESLDGAPFRVLASHGAPPDFVDFDPAADAPRNRYEIRWDLTAMDRAGTVPWFWVLETDRPECPVVDVRVRHDDTRPTRSARRPWVPKDQRVLLGRVAPGTPVEAELRIEYHGNMTPAPETAGIAGDTDQLHVELMEVEQKDQVLRYHLRITPKPGPKGLLYDVITYGASGFTESLRVIGVRE